MPEIPATSRPDLRALDKRERSRKRIEKMKAGLEKKEAAARGETTAMPLSGKAALAKIRAKR